MIHFFLYISAEIQRKSLLCGKFIWIERNSKANSNSRKIIRAYIGSHAHRQILGKAFHIINWFSSQFFRLLDEV